MEEFVKRLKREREQHSWSQEQVAQMIGTTAPNVSRWERGTTFPGLHFRQKLSELFGKSAAELGLMRDDNGGAQPSSPMDQQPASSFIEAPARVWHVPHSRNLFFTGREDLLLQIRTAITSESYPLAVSQPQAVSGLGGIGKTQLVVEYAYRYRGMYDVIMWTRADSRDLLVSDFLLAAELLRLPERNEQDQRVVINAVKRWFNTHERWLLIMDNANQVEEVSEFFPSTDMGHILLTTRAHATGTAAQRIVVEQMTQEEGILFLLRRTKLVKGNTVLEQIPGTIRAQAQAVVDEVDGLPLALDQAGAYIEETDCSLSDYLMFYRIGHQRLLNRRGRESTGHPESVAATWSLSFGKVEQNNPVAAALLRLCALLHPDAIPETMIAEGATELGPILHTLAGNQFNLNEAISELLRYSLIRRDPESKVLTIHRLIQMVLIDTMDKEEYAEWAKRVVRMVNKVFPVVLDSLPWMCYEVYLPQAQVCASLVDQIGSPVVEAAQLFTKTGAYLTRRARYTEAGPLLRRALAVYESMPEPNLLDVIECMNHLGWLYQEEGKYEKGEALYQRALVMGETALGSEHSSTAASLHYLAGLYQEQGRYREARPIIERSLAIREMVLGPNHLDTADSMSYLAWLNTVEEQYAEAEALYSRVLAIREAILGPEHPYFATNLNNLAEVSYAQGRYDEAETLYQQALAIRKKTLGHSHPDTVVSRKNYIQLLRTTGRESEAAALEAVRED
jgi:tetratricopeptide (TPR) repeat protein/transcriptional regulator with XRE-family HTH domain